MPDHAYYEKHKERYKQQNNARYLAHREDEIKNAIEWQRKNPERFRQTQNERLKKHPEKRAEIRQKYRMRNPEKYHAHNVAGKLPIANTCEFCGLAENLGRHHPDYSYPTIFVTACGECHRVIDEDNIGGRPRLYFDAGVNNTGEAAK